MAPNTAISPLLNVTGHVPLGTTSILHGKPFHLIVYPFATQQGLIIEQKTCAKGLTTVYSHRCAVLNCPQRWLQRLVW